MLKSEIESGKGFLFDTDEIAGAIVQKIKFPGIERHGAFNFRKTIDG